MCWRRTPLDILVETLDSSDMEAPRALAEKARKHLREHPESRETVTQSFDRLIRFLNLSEQEARNLRLLAGLSVPGFSFLSITKDEGIYDILDTYELGARFRVKGSWEGAWSSIAGELNTPDPIYGTTDSSTLERLRASFEEVSYAAGSDPVPESLFFENFVRDSDGKLIILE